MEEQTDKTFIKNISIVLAILVVFTIVIIFVARDIGFKDGDEANNPSRQATIEENIKPVAGVHTGEAGAAAIAAAASAEPAEQAVAFDGSLDAEMIYNTVCAACHATEDMAAALEGWDQAEIRDTLDKLDELSDEMLPFEGSPEEKDALTNFLHKLGREN